MKDLNPHNLLQISMDGPSTNWKFFDQFVEEHNEDPDCPNLVNLGSCRIHVIHGAFKTAVTASEWMIDSLLRSLYYLFKDSPAKSEKFQEITKEQWFPLQFCSTHWFEDVPVAERAIEIWPAITMFISKLENGPKKDIPKTKSFKNLQEHKTDVLIVAKLQFFKYVATILSPFLQRFQSNKPMAPFLGEELEKILKTVMSLFVKSSVMNKADSVRQLLKIDVNKAENVVDYKSVVCGMAVKAELTLLQSSKKVSPHQVMEFKNACICVLQTLTTKLMERSPLAYPLAHDLKALDPRYIASESDDQVAKKMEKVLQAFMKHKWMNAQDCDIALRQYKALIVHLKRTCNDDHDTISWLG